MRSRRIVLPSNFRIDRGGGTGCRRDSCCSVEAEEGTPPSAVAGVWNRGSGGCLGDRDRRRSRRIMETTFREECQTEPFGEQVVLCCGLSAPTSMAVLLTRFYSTRFVGHRVKHCPSASRHHEQDSFGATSSPQVGPAIRSSAGSFNLPNDVDEGPQTGWNIPPPWVIEAQAGGLKASTRSAR